MAIYMNDGRPSAMSGGSRRQSRDSNLRDAQSRPDCTTVGRILSDGTPFVVRQNLAGSFAEPLLWIVEKRRWPGVALRRLVAAALTRNWSNSSVPYRFIVVCVHLRLDLRRRLAVGELTGNLSKHNIRWLVPIRVWWLKTSNFYATHRRGYTFRRPTLTPRGGNPVDYRQCFCVGAVRTWIGTPVVSNPGRRSIAANESGNCSEMDDAEHRICAAVGIQRWRFGDNVVVVVVAVPCGSSAKICFVSGLFH